MISPSALDLMLEEGRLSETETAHQAMARRILATVVVGLEEAGCPVTAEQAAFLLAAAGIS